MSYLSFFSEALASVHLIDSFVPCADTWDYRFGNWAVQRCLEAASTADERRKIVTCMRFVPLPVACALSLILISGTEVVSSNLPPTVMAAMYYKKRSIVRKTFVSSLSPSC